MCKLPYQNDWLLASGGNDASVKIWEIEDGEGCRSLVQVGECELPEGENDRVTCMMAISQQEVYKDHLIVFTELKQFYLYQVSPN